MSIIFESHPHTWKHPSWNKIQLRYFEEHCKTRREKNLEDFIITNGIKKLHLVRDNNILDDFLENHILELVEPENADAVIITSQQFSRLDASVILEKLNTLLLACPTIYFCLNKYYLNANESIQDNELVENYDVAIVQWLSKHIPNSTIVNLTEIFVEDGSCFTWVIPSSEILICKK